MALNVLKAGHTMVVNDIRQEMAAPHLRQGATWADTPKAVAEQSELIFTSLPGPREVEAVALGEHSIIEGVAPGAIYADLSTSSATLIRVPMMVAGLVEQQLEEALRRGLAEKDSSAIFLLREERAGVQVRDPQVR
jgi:NAD binding domain of 6-phosphogluconate dehydrogenase